MLRPQGLHLRSQPRSIRRGLGEARFLFFHLFHMELPQPQGLVSNWKAKKGNEMK